MTDQGNLEERQARLSPAKRALLLRRLQGLSGGLPAEGGIPRRVGADAPVLSFAQQRLWFLDRLEPGRPTYNIPYAISWRGPLRRDVLERVLEEIVSRHEVLRTTFRLAGDQPTQVIAAPGKASVPLKELQHLPPGEREQESRRLAEEEATAPFDLAHGPLMRVCLLQLAAEEYHLLITFHHIIFDGTSEPLFFGELRILYDAFAAGEPSPLPDLPIQYADYSLWQEKHLRGEILGRELDYWRATLAGDPVPLAIPTDHPRPVVPGVRGGTERIALPDVVHVGLLHLAHSEGATLFMVLLAAFDVFLARWTGQDDIVVGTPMAGRIRPETEPLLGFFVNTLVLRTDLSRCPSFLDALRRAKDSALGAFDHQELPFDRLVAELQPDRERSRSPLFDVMFTLQQRGDDRSSPVGVVWSDLTTDVSAPKFDLVLTFQEMPRGLRAVLEYRSDLFLEATARRMLRSLAVLLHSIVLSPAEPLASLRLLDGEDQALLEAHSNGSALRYPVEQTYDRAFAARVRETPKAIAVAMGSEQVTYAELDARANRLAHELRSFGVRPETRIAIWMERSVSLAIAFLGVLKAGGAFVPLDPAYPDDRLLFMIEDAGIQVILTERKHVPRIPPRMEHVICLDEEKDPAVPAGWDIAPPSNATPDTTAYVIYTSGSSGRPKGVLISHRSLLHNNHCVMHILGLTVRDRVLQFFSLSFDASIEDIFPTWLAGATLVFRREDVTTTIARFCAYLDEERITVLKLPMAYWHEMAEESARMRLPRSIRLVTIGGERASAHKLGLWRARVGTGVRVVNFYGPTETTVSATYCEIQDLPTTRDIPIGRPFPNTRVVLRDPSGGEVPPGAVGEITIGGPGVAKGYLNRRDLTDEKFVRDRTGARMYRTGDLGRFREDGAIEFLGRLDSQVKIRGYRIEPGEIESVLGTHPKVSRSIVTAVAGGSGTAMLVGYVVPQAGCDTHDLGGELLAWLRSRLPDYMIPPVIETLTALPFLPNGKVNVRALPVPGNGAARQGAGFVAPRDSMELQLAVLWEDILRRKPIGVFDNFFALGGHSLLAARLFARLDQMTGRNLPLATLFQAPTIDALASLLRQEGWVAPWSSLVPIKASGSRLPLYCIHAAGGNVIGYTALAACMDPEQPVYGIQSVGLDGTSQPFVRVEAMASHYVEEIRRFQPEGPYYLGGECAGGIIALEIAQQLRAAGQSVALLAMFDAFPGGGDPAVSKGRRFLARGRSLYDRIAYQLDNLILKPHRLEYIGKKLRTLKRRIRSRLWRTAYGSLSIAGRGLPPALQNVEEANLLALRRYRPRPYDGKITVFTAAEVSVGQGADAAVGWSAFAIWGMENHVVPGRHVTFLAEPHVRVLAARLEECIRTATAGVTGR